ncbi:MAG: hypothetical protein ISS36_02065 [Candidatus Aenigmarchaeota archaeon]|nr:hypothetical protein [Candidatus Aenigmarchaeota archaeon]
MNFPDGLVDLSYHGRIFHGIITSGPAFFYIEGDTMKSFYFDLEDIDTEGDPVEHITVNSGINLDWATHFTCEQGPVRGYKDKLEKLRAEEALA